MPEDLHPGVYIEEIERGPRPIEGVPTSTAAFLGETERGPLRPTLVTNSKEYSRRFGTVFADGCFMPHAAAGFFEIRVMEGSTVRRDGGPGFRLRLAHWNTLPTQAFDPFVDTTLRPRPQIIEEYDDLSINPLSSDYFGKRLIDTSSNQSAES